MYHNPPGNLYIFIIGASVLIIALNLVITGIFLRYRQYKVRHEARLAAIKAGQEQLLLKTKIEVQEEALQRVAMEIHDNVMQVIGMSRLTLTALLPQTKFPAAPTKRKIDYAAGLLQKAITDLRTISHTYSSRLIEADGLLASLAKELDYIQAFYHIHCVFDHPPTLPRLPAGTAILLYRIVQEAIQNIFKHAHAQQIHIRIVSAENSLMLSITDDGKGADLNHLTGGLGLRSIDERTQLLGGTLKVESTPDKGFHLEIVMPV